MGDGLKRAVAAALKTQQEGKIMAAKKATAATTTSTGMIGSVDMSKVDREVLIEYAKRLKCGTDKDTNEALVVALQARFGKLGADRLADCSDCGGESDKELEVCPFCGASDDDDASAASSVSASDDDDVPTGESAPDDDDASDDDMQSSVSVDTASASIDDDPEEVRRTLGDRAADAMMGKADDTEIDASKMGIEEPPTTGRRLKKTAASKKTAAAKGNALAPAVPEVKAEIVQDHPQYTEKDLDEAVDRVNAAKGRAGVAHYHLGHEIKKIYDQELWKQRNAANGGRAYDNFNQFVMQELKFTKQTAYWLMDVSVNFTEAQFEKFGRTKLGAMLMAPKDERDRLLDMAQAGATVEELKSEARAASEKAGAATQERDTGRRQKPRKKGERTKGNRKKTTPRKPTITVAALLGRHMVKLYKGAKPEVRATKLGDQPTGYFDLENGARMHVIIASDPSGNLVARLDFKRIDDE